MAAPFSPNQLVLNFNEFLSAATALNTANYNVTNGLGVKVNVISANFIRDDPRTVILTGSKDA